MLVSAEPIVPDNYGAYCLNGAQGFTNAISELDKISAMYGQGDRIKNARNITVEDINQLTGYHPECVGIKNPTKDEIEKGTKAGIVGIEDTSDFKEGTVGYMYNDTASYGSEITYLWDGTESPKYETKTGKSSNLTERYTSGFYWFDFEGNAWKSSRYASRTEKIATVQNNSYEYYPQTLTSENDQNAEVGLTNDSVEYQMLFEGTQENEYFLASRSCKTTQWGTSYAIRRIAEGAVLEYEMINSTGKESMYNAGVRPVIILDSSVVLTKTAQGWELI